MTTQVRNLAMETMSVVTPFRQRVARSQWLWSFTQRVAAMAALVLISPLFAGLYIVVRGTSRGPFLFRQQRPGLSNRPFTIYKIRTMTVGSETKTALGVTEQSAEITSVGQILRRLKLDELPQLWNVARGDMQLVGPRPLPTALFRELSAAIPHFRLRGAVKPGLTNVSQVAVMDNGLGDRLIADWKLRFEGELHYIRNRSFAYDVVVIAMTSIYVLRKLGWGRPAEMPQGSAAYAGIPITLVAGTPVANVDYQGVVVKIADWVRERGRRYICICPVHSIVEAVWNPGHAEALRGAAINTADGMPVVWAQRWFGHTGASRVYGPTLMLETLEKAAREGWRVAFYGGQSATLTLLTNRLKKKFPGLKVVAAISPPFRRLSETEDNQMVDSLSRARPDVVFVGLGCPKQERWMLEHSPRIPGVMLGVGAAFDFHAGSVRQAPPRLQRLGLEWLFRLCCEPKRLFRRYATTNPAYIGMILKQLTASLFLRRRFQLSPVRSSRHSSVGERVAV